MNFKISDGHLTGFSWIAGEKVDTIRIPDGTQSIDAFALTSGNPVRRLILPEGLEVLADYALSGLQQLEEVTLPSSLRAIGHHAFCSCRSIKRVIIPDSVASLGSYALADCHALEEVVLPAGLTAIPDALLQNCRSLTRIDLPQGITSIGATAFIGCAALEHIPLTDHITHLGPSAFCGCASVRSIMLPASLRALPSRLCKDCTSLEQVYLPPALEEIGPQAFHACTSLRRIPLPTTLRTIGFMAFSECHALTHVNLSEGVQQIHNRAFAITQQNMDRLISLPPDLTMLDPCALWGCNSMGAPRSALVLLGGTVLCGQLSDVSPACPGARTFHIPRSLHVSLPCGDDVTLEAACRHCGAYARDVELILAPERGREVLTRLQEHGLDDIVLAAMRGFIRDLRSGYLGNDASARCYAEAWSACRGQEGIPDVHAVDDVPTEMLRRLAAAIAHTQPDLAAELLRIIHARPAPDDDLSL